MEASSGLATGPGVFPGTFLSGCAGELHQLWTVLGGCGVQPARGYYIYVLFIYTSIYNHSLLGHSLVFSCSFSVTGLATITPYKYLLPHCLRWASAFPTVFLHMFGSPSWPLVREKALCFWH